MILQLAFNSCWKVTVTGQAGIQRQVVVKVLWLPKVSATYRWFSYVICIFLYIYTFFYKSYILSPFLRTWICLNSQRQELFYLANNRHFEFIFLGSQIFFHLPISVHMALSMGRIEMWLTPIPRQFSHWTKLNKPRQAEFDTYQGVKNVSLSEIFA